MKQILVVEDDPAIRELLEMNLTVAGYACESAADGAAAIRMVSSKRYDLALRKRGTGILLASHNPVDIAALCDEVYEMDAGVLTRSDVIK